MWFLDIKTWNSHSPNYGHLKKQGISSHKSLEIKKKNLQKTHPNPSFVQGYPWFLGQRKISGFELPRWFWLDHIHYKDYITQMFATFCPDHYYCQTTHLLNRVPFSSTTHLPIEKTCESISAAMHALICWNYSDVTWPGPPKCSWFQGSPRRFQGNTWWNVIPFGRFLIHPLRGTHMPVIRFDPGILCTPLILRRKRRPSFLTFHGSWEKSKKRQM